jgi:hypothetical protein
MEFSLKSAELGKFRLSKKSPSFQGSGSSGVREAYSFIGFGNRVVYDIAVRRILYLLIALTYLSCPVFAAVHGHGAEEKGGKRKASPVPHYKPASQPVTTGEFLVGFITITFKETVAPEDAGQAMRSANQVSSNPQYAESGKEGKPGEYSSGVDLEEYFKVYSNGITWPKLVVMHDENTSYEDPHFYGYYCEYDYWRNPIGWKERQEGSERVKEMNENALRFAKKSYRGDQPRFLCYNYVTRRPGEPTEEVSIALLDFYENRNADPDRTKPVRTRRSREPEDPAEDFDPWDFYRPVCKWGEPAWPNSKVQINDFSGGVLAHELGHSLGAPDVYRVGRFNDGIGGEASLLAYGPTANAFSRFYHHAFIGERNHPAIKTAGTYTLHPRHITPQGNEALGYLIPSNHPHYMYHVEYIHGEDGIAGVGPRHEGMLISVVNLGLTNYLGSPDYFYVYRPEDPFFRGGGNTNQCLFGKSHNRTEFNMTTEPSSRLPNLMDGGVSFKNIEEKDGTLTFELETDRRRISGSEYAESMLPQIRLDEIRDIQPTSFAMDCTIKFRGEPLITIYGFCWSTSKNPTVRDGTYTLAHRECHRGHAIHLRPRTTYYVRAFATNGVGVRYSDEEKMIQTPDFETAPASIGPLFTDYYSDNRYLFNEYSTENTSPFIGYSPTCVLAKLIAYYRPERFEVSSPETRSKNSDIDFGQLSWNPSADDYPMRLEEVDKFFQHIYRRGSELEFHNTKPGKDFLRNLAEITGFRSKPVLSELDPDNLKAVSELIQADLTQSRPVVILFTDGLEPMKWALIDGIGSTGKMHVDFPLNSKFMVAGEELKPKSGDCVPGVLMMPGYKTYVVTSCFDED